MATRAPHAAEFHQLALDGSTELQTDGTHIAGQASTAPARPADGADRQHRIRRPTARDLLDRSGALLTRSHLRELGLERRAIDAVFRALPVVAIPGYSRPLIRAADYIDLIERNTFRDDRVRPIRRPS
jgi:hypothetical protein